MDRDSCLYNLVTDADALEGANKTDMLIGRSGVDTLDGLAGRDTLRGGSGHDEYRLTRADLIEGDVIESKRIRTRTARNSFSFNISPDARRNRRVDWASGEDLVR